MSSNQNRNINVLWVAESNWAIGSGIKAHTHEYYHLFMVRQGPMTVIANDECITLTDGETLLAPPGIVHGLNDTTIRISRAYEIKFAIDSPRLNKQLANLPLILPASTFATELVQELIAESSRQELASSDFVAEYMLCLVNFYYRHYGEPAIQETTVIDTTGYSKVSTSIVQFLEANYNREVSLQEVADHVDLNRNYVCSLFKKDSGMTIGNCQTIIRIRKAAEMISFSDMSIAQVAAATGFTNLSHFNRIFRKVVGIPPGQYRKMFTADMIVTSTDYESAEESCLQNGFIISVLGRKRMTIADIVNYLNDASAAAAATDAASAGSDTTTTDATAKSDASTTGTASAGSDTTASAAASDPSIPDAYSA